MMNENMAREVREARAAGIRALNSLRRAERCLDSARGWGIWDMLGGGLISGLVKHSKLNDAQQQVDEARRDLESFSRELRDVNLPEVRLDGLAVMADLLWDSLLADIMVQGRINEARRQLALACAEVEAALRQLPTM